MNMSGPVGLADVFAAITLLIALLSAGRLVLARLWSRPILVDVDVEHLLMGGAMAGMFVASLNPIPAGVWEVVFSCSAAWFLWRSIAHLRGHSASMGGQTHPVGHYPTHLVMACAMLYMYLAPSTEASGASGSMAMGAASPSSGSYVELPLLFLLVLLASGIFELDRAAQLWRIRSVAVAAPALQYATVGGTASLEVSAEGSGGLSVAVGGRIATENEGRSLLAPGMMAALHVGMCVAMGYMLIVML